MRTLRPKDIALVLSTTKEDIEALERLQKGEEISKTARSGILPGDLAKDLAASNGIEGQTACVSLACISGLAALRLGADWIEEGMAQAVVVVGADLASEFVQAGFSSLQSLDARGCHPFDRYRQGLIVAEGAGAMVLLPADRTGHPRTILAGFGISNDANHLTGPSKDGGGLTLAMQRALLCACVSPPAVDYLHAHGTGTLFNDSMEALAFGRIFGNCIPPFSSTKAVTGHALGAAGTLETIVCELAFRQSMLPGTAGLASPADDIPDSVLSAPRKAEKLKTILKINAGFGGMNAAAVFLREEGP
jgi:3-oxoacyl-(acyl-carrier-protein) synthase